MDQIKKYNYFLILGIVVGSAALGLILYLLVKYLRKPSQGKCPTGTQIYTDCSNTTCYPTCDSQTTTGNFNCSTHSCDCITGSTDYCLDGKCYSTCDPQTTTGNFNCYLNKCTTPAFVFFTGVRPSIPVWSNNGKDWNIGSGENFDVSVNLFGGNSSTIQWNGSLFVAIGIGTNQILNSNDGKQWNKPTSGSTPFGNNNSYGGTAIVWTGKTFITCGYGDNQIVWSNDGQKWQNSTIPTDYTPKTTMALAFNNSSTATIVAVGGGVGPNLIAYSNNEGQDWNLSTLPEDVLGNNFTSVIWNGTYFIAIGDKQMLYSTDGISWNLCTTSLFSNRSFASNETTSVVVGYGDYTDTNNTNQILISSDKGMTWKPPVQGGLNIFTNNPGFGANSVIWNGTNFIAFGQISLIYYSTDGITWSKSSGVTIREASCVWWNTDVVVVTGYDSTNCTILYSIDNGESWKSVSCDTKSNTCK